jgi:hypothetical protein
MKSILGSLTGDSVVIKQLQNIIIPVFEDRKSFAGTCVPTVLPDPPMVNRKIWSLKKFLRFMEPEFLLPSL